ncbi:induced myeloid leukemia cell differentiation protein Mcl-1 [Discoglossus pictus]
MMNQSFMALNRKSAAAGMMPYNLYCQGGGVGAKAGAGAVTSSPTHITEAAPRPELAPGLSAHQGLPLRSTSAAWQLEGREKEEAARKGYNTDGSLPCSQEDELEEDTESVSRGSTSPLPSPTCPKDALYQQTLSLVLDLFREHSGQEGPSIKDILHLGVGSHRKALETLRRVAREVIEKHQIAFQGMLQKLTIRNSEDLQKLSDLPSMVFNDGITNWGRIVTLISFGAFVAKYLKSIHLEDCIAQLAENFTDFLMSNKRDWIVQQKGWDGFVEFFHVEDYEGGFRTVLMAFAGVAGIGASLAYMIR